MQILIKYIIIMDGKEGLELELLDKLTKIIADSAKNEKHSNNLVGGDKSINYYYLIRVLEYLIQIFKLKM